ncbi:hypothetical protein [Halobacterium hubeiense]|uniref:hypothetical protein n=1 Tax=Halobacterium hubeiense TaxID=1407499 RepID=UPI003C768792
MVLQSLSLRQLTLGKEAGVVFTVLVGLWLSRQGELDPLSLLGVYLTAVVLTAVYFGIQSLVTKQRP